MAGIRAPLQGILNIIRFNWHFYVLSLGFIILIIILGTRLPEPYPMLATIASLMIALPITVSLLVSLYVYDLSGLYELRWLEPDIGSGSKVVNINAGFDETSLLLKEKYPGTDLTVFDFYDPATHTEVSIKRARQAYPPYPNTQQVTTKHLPLPGGYADRMFLIMAAHEIRNEEERTVFFRELSRSLKDDGRIVVTEHLRDLPNFIAYTIGFFHFYPKSAWRRVFAGAGLRVAQEIKVTPFISTFILEKHGAAS